jgi:hypothetical protein
VKILSFVLPVLLFISGSFANARSLSFAQPKLVKVPGTKVSLAPPTGLKPSSQFPGFDDQETGASITIAEMPGPYSVMAEGMTKEALAAKGISLLSRKEISLNGRPGILLHLRQEISSVDVLKWLAVTGNEKETIFIAATFPEQVKARWSSEMEKSVLSARLDGEPGADPLAGLNFSFSDDPSLKVAMRFPSKVILTEDGDMQGGGPLFIVSSSPSEAIIPDVKKFAEQLMQTAQVSGITIKKQSDVTIAGLPGNEIVAEAKWNASPGEAVIIYQVLLLDKKNYFLMQGFASRGEQEKYLAVFARIAQSFRKK